MTIMMGKLYTALRDANVPEDKAREAAEEVAAFEASLNDLIPAALRGDRRP